MGVKLLARHTMLSGSDSSREYRTWRRRFEKHVDCDFRNGFLKNICVQVNDFSGQFFWA